MSEGDIFCRTSKSRFSWHPYFSLSLSLSLSVFFFSTPVKNNIIFYKFAVDPKRAKQIIRKDIKVLPWLGICFLIKFLSWCSHSLRSMAVLSSGTHYGFPSSNWYQTDNDWHQVFSMSLIYSCTEQTLRVSNNIESVFSWVLLDWSIKRNWLIGRYFEWIVMGMVNSETPADIFCNQFFTIFFVIYCAARNSLTCVPDAFTLKS